MLFRSSHLNFLGAAANLPPNVTLLAPSNGGTVTTSTPNLEFTTTDPNGDDFKFELQVDTVSTFDSQSGSPLQDIAPTYTYSSGSTLLWPISSVPDGTYYWRARAIDPTGSNTWGAWSATWSFTVQTTTTSTITKSATYAVQAAHSVTKGATYAVKTTGTLTKSAAYQVKTSTTNTLGLSYAVTAAVNYSREATTTLPTTDVDLSTIYTSTEKTDVATANGTYVTVSGVDATYLIHEFKQTNTNATDTIALHWYGKTNIAPSVKAVHMQAYNYTTSAWVTVASDTTSAADTEFALDATISTSVADYYSGTNEVSVRVYQDA